jgi:hypothetical protein
MLRLTVVAIVCHFCLSFAAQQTSLPAAEHRLHEEPSPFTFQRPRHDREIDRDSDRDSDSESDSDSGRDRSNSDIAIGSDCDDREAAAEAAAVVAADPDPAPESNILFSLPLYLSLGDSDKFEDLLLVHRTSLQTRTQLCKHWPSSKNTT